MAITSLELDSENLGQVLYLSLIKHLNTPVSREMLDWTVYV